MISPSSRTTILLSQLIFIPSMLLGGLMIPYAASPASAQRLALLLPTTYAMNSSAARPWDSRLTSARCYPPWS